MIEAALTSCHSSHPSSSGPLARALDPSYIGLCRFTNPGACASFDSSSPDDISSFCANWPINTCLPYPTNQIYFRITHNGTAYVLEAFPDDACSIVIVSGTSPVNMCFLFVSVRLVVDVYCLPLNTFSTANILSVHRSIYKWHLCINIIRAFHYCCSFHTISNDSGGTAYVVPMRLSGSLPVLVQPVGCRYLMRGC